MKTFRLTLSIGGVVLLDAERYEVRDGMMYFYRDEAIVAEYAQASVVEISEAKVPTQKIGLFESWLTKKEETDEARGGGENPQITNHKIQITR